MTMHQPADTAEDIPQDLEPTQAIAPETPHKPISRNRLVNISAIFLPENTLRE